MKELLTAEEARKIYENANLEDYYLEQILILIMKQAEQGYCYADFDFSDSINWDYDKANLALNKLRDLGYDVEITNYVFEGSFIKIRW